MWSDDRFYLTVATSTSFINFGAFTAFTFVNLCVIAMFIRGSRAGDAKQNVVTHIVFPAIGAIVDVYLLFSLDATAKLSGPIWLACGTPYLTDLMRSSTLHRKSSSSRNDVG